MPRRTFQPLLLLLASAAILGTALASQYWGGLRPCVLCIYQRYPYAVVIGLSAIALAFAARDGGRLPAALLALSAVALGIGAAIAAYHVGVEQHWWVGTAECGMTETAGTVEALRAQILGRAPVRCDEIAWSLFGISMAGYNVVASLLLGGYAAWAARLTWQDNPS
ncbi:MAG: disulfide bond formation protein B [Alphaproteobacteria bacterium]|nr:disulfide bond formation protein B [Alphaproteobacteria bacterium]